MAHVQFFTDEDIYGAVAPGLRNAGFDAVSAPESGRLGESDESQLQWASDNARVIVTFNVAHFTNLHSQWMARGLHHAGIVVSQQRPIGDLLRRLLHLATQLSQETIRDRLEYRNYVGCRSEN